MTWFSILKNPRPDYPDLDGDGDEEEPMVDALETVEQVESVKKFAPSYTLKNGVVVKLPKGLRIGRSNNRIVEETHRILLENPDGLSPRAVVGHLFAESKVKAGTIPDKARMIAYFKINGNVYKKGTQEGTYKVIDNGEEN